MVIFKRQQKKGNTLKSMALAYHTAWASGIAEGDSTELGKMMGKKPSGIEFQQSGLQQLPESPQEKTALLLSINDQHYLEGICS